MTETRSESTRFQRGSEVVPSDVVSGSSVEDREEPWNRDHVMGPNPVPEPDERNHVVKRGTHAENSGDTAAATPVERRAAAAVRGGSDDPERGTWCTNPKLAKALGRFHVDPFSNPDSYIEADAACMLERGDDGFGKERVKRLGEGWFFRSQFGYSRTYADTKVFIQPPYKRGFPMRAFRHYAHTRWVCLLRFDPRPEWFDLVLDACELYAVIRDPEARNFEPPPGVTAPGSTFPHALYYRHAEDVTDDVLELCNGLVTKKQRRT